MSTICAFMLGVRTATEESRSNTMFSRALILTTWMTLSASLIAACNDSEDPPERDASLAPSSDASLGPSSDAAADAKTSDAAPGADSSADSSTSTAPVITPPAPVVCGSKTCTAPQGGMVPNVACCLPDGSCGAAPDLGSFAMGAMGMSTGGSGLGGTCLDVSAGTPDPSCPSQSVMNFALGGCCSKAGVCGLDLSIGGLGCNALGALGALASFTGGGAMDAGPPQKCGGSSSDAGADSSVDAGVDSGVDAGADSGDGAAALPGDGSSTVDGSSNDH
jgi:hypothetical protein